MVCGNEGRPSMRLSSNLGCVQYWLDFQSVKEGRIRYATLQNGHLCNDTMEYRCNTVQTEFGACFYMQVQVTLDQLGNALIWVKQEDIRCIPANFCSEEYESDNDW